MIPTAVPPLARRPRHVIALPICVAIALALLAPCAALAQAQRAAPDAPTRSAETRRLTDSLTVHRLRRPKAKSIQTEAGSRASMTAKHLGAVDTASYRAVLPTPLPQKNRKTSARP
jgi:hypothetical protein